MVAAGVFSTPFTVQSVQSIIMKYQQQARVVSAAEEAVYGRVIEDIEAGRLEAKWIAAMEAIRKEEDGINRGRTVTYPPPDEKYTPRPLHGLVQCPVDSGHWVKPTRLHMHLLRCRAQHGTSQ